MRDCVPPFPSPTSLPVEVSSHFLQEFFHQSATTFLENVRVSDLFKELGIGSGIGVLGHCVRVFFTDSQISQRFFD